MKRTSLWILKAATVALFSVPSMLLAKADHYSRYMDIKDVKVKMVGETFDVHFPQYANNCSEKGEPKNRLHPHSAEEGIDPSEIVNLGLKIWKIIEDNKPVVNVRGMTAQALPSGITCWDQLEGWKIPISREYEVTYVNGFNMDVVKFNFRILFTYGGRFNGVGAYIANLSIMPEHLDVSWGYKFDAEVKVPYVVNLGTRENPVAGSQISLDWNVRTPLKDSRASVVFFVSGNGELVEL